MQLRQVSAKHILICRVARDRIIRRYMVKLIPVMRMSWWNKLVKILQYQPNLNREGFVLKETSQERAKLADQQPKKKGAASPDQAKPKRERGERRSLKKPLRVHEDQAQEDPDRVSPSLQVNKKRIYEIYGLPENKDFIIRDFTVAINPPVQAFALFMEGLSDKASVNQYVLQPMMLFSNFHQETEGYLLDYLEKRVLITNQVNQYDSFEKIVGGVNYGATAIFIEGCPKALVVETKGWDHRGIDTPSNEPIIRGPQEGFGEILRSNTALVRKYIRSAQLTTEIFKLGKISQNDVAVMYLRGVANQSLVAEVKRRIKSIQVDAVLDSGILEQLIEDQPWNIAPQVMATERPDRVAYMIMQGKVAVFLDGNPFVLVVPTTMFDQLHSQEDYYLRPLYGSMLRLIRAFAFYVAFLTPGVYLAIVLFHKEMIPTELLLAIAGARERVPFPSFVEVVLMEVSFELIREAGLRVPGVLGSTIGIVGALILGQAAVQANLVSPILVIIVAVTALAGFAIPSYSLQFSLRIVRFMYIMLGALLGFIGIVFGLFIQMHMMASLKSFGVPYLSPMSPATNTSGDVVFRVPAFSWEKRADYLNTQKENLQPRVARGWVKDNNNP
ncbi:spore germination protein GerKA [Desulfotomaculum varum]